MAPFGSYLAPSRKRLPLWILAMLGGLLAREPSGFPSNSPDLQINPLKWLQPEKEEPDAGSPDAGSTPDAAAANESSEEGAGPGMGRFGTSGPSGRFDLPGPRGRVVAGGKVEGGAVGGRRNIDLGEVGKKPVLQVDIDGTIDLGLAPFIRRAVDKAESIEAAALVLRINTFGGRVDAAVQIRDALLDSKVKTVAFIDKRAISAGALISLATDIIAVTPGATMGAATPVQLGGGGKAQPVAEKVVSYMRKEMRSTAEAKGRRGDIAEAMVDADVELDVPFDLDGARKGKLLTLTSQEGLRLNMMDIQAKNETELYRLLGLADCPKIKIEVNWAETIARWLTDPMISSLLMTIGFLGILLELYTPGLGFAGGLGLLCLAIFFTGHMVVHLAGFEELLIFLAGVICLVLEIVVTPGFGVLGASGIGLILVSLIMAMVELPIEVSWEAGFLTTALLTVLAALAGTVILMFLLYRLLPRGGPLHRLVLSTALLGDAAPSTAAGFSVAGSTAEESSVVGQEGVALTDLNPTGKGRIGDRKLEVQSDGDYVEAGESFRVMRIEGLRIVVRRLDPED